MENLTVWFKIQIFKSSLPSEIISRKKFVAGFFLLNHIKPLSYNSIIKISIGFLINPYAAVVKNKTKTAGSLQETG